MTYRAVIKGTGMYTPEKVLTNADFERMVDTSDEWIVSRTGIKERRVRSDGLGTSDMCVAASRQALDEAGLGPDDVDAIMVATVTPDYWLPSTATIVQTKLGCRKAMVMDLVAACTGFLYGLNMARAFIGSGQYENVLVIGAEMLSSITNYEDRNTCVLFGDGGGAVVVTRGDQVTAGNGKPADGAGILATHMSADGQYGDLLHIPGGGSSDRQGIERHIVMDGREVFKHAVREMADACDRVMTEAGVAVEDIDLFVPHQANIRIIDALAKRFGISRDKVYVNIERYGNTSAASVPIALAEAKREGRVGPGTLVLAAAFGGGLTWGAALIRF